MNSANVQQKSQTTNDLLKYTLPFVFTPGNQSEVEMLVTKLAPETPWGERKVSAEKLGLMRNPEAVPGLIAALPTDPFWMVRCAIIQALEKIGDHRAVAVLQEVAHTDSFEVVRSYAQKAAGRLAHE